MPWLTELATENPVAWAVLVLMSVAVGGLALASLKVKGVGLGIAGVLFAGIAFGHLGCRIEKEILEFVREFGLILFVFTIGLQLGPSFFASLRKQGLKLNFLAALVVISGGLITAGLIYLGKIDRVAAVGLFSGATTNTPSLGATQTMLKGMSAYADQSGVPALAYAVSYPGGVFGIITVLLLLRFLFRIDPEQESERFREDQRKGVDVLEHMNLVVENANLDGLAIGQVPGGFGEVVVSRIQRKDDPEVQTATEQTRLHLGDHLLAVGTHRALERFRVVIGRETDVNLKKSPGRVVSRRIIVTRKAVLGKSILELGLDETYGVTVTRVLRADLEMTALPEMKLQFGDALQVVGNKESIPQVAAALGNSVAALNETNFVPIFIGIALGVLCGTIPLAIPGMPVPVRLGIAGGPLVVAILLSRIGRIGPLLWHMPANANVAFRELGIVLFLACVGLKAGEKFFSTVLTTQGLHWLVGGFLLTVVPIFLIGLVARLIFKMNFNAISGLIAGSMTDPPALAFAHAVCRSDAPSVAYATVYPLTMLLRIIAVQVMILLFCQ